jgi:hypothetical protein
LVREDFGSRAAPPGAACRASVGRRGVRRPRSSPMALAEVAPRPGVRRPGPAHQPGTALDRKRRERSNCVTNGKAVEYTVSAHSVRPWTLEPTSRNPGPASPSDCTVTAHGFQSKGGRVGGCRRDSRVDPRLRFRARASPLVICLQDTARLG